MSYSQPPTAPFSHDSIEAADRLSQRLLELAPLSLTTRQSTIKLLDLCAGCGVMGLETERRYRQKAHLQKHSQALVTNWTFLELRSEYQAYFALNRDRYFPEVESSSRFEFRIGNFRDLLLQPAFDSQFDFIISNPPYFEVGQGRLPPDPIKREARFLLNGSFAELVRAVGWCLKPQGEAYVLVRDLFDHGINREIVLRAECENANLEWEMLPSIRGTGFVRFIKSSKLNATIAPRNCGPDPY